MFKGDSLSKVAGLIWFDHTERLNRYERAATLVIVAFLALVDIIAIFATGVGLTDQLLSLAMTLTLALYVWSPVLATAALAFVSALAYSTGDIHGVALGGAIAALPVFRLGSSPLILAYAGGFLTISGTFGMVGVGHNELRQSDIIGYIFIAFVAGALGMTLRMAFARSSRLEEQLAEQAEHEREVVLAERRWIAGELHDSIAHHLTVISLHAQTLDDEDMRPISQEAIRVASQRALSDLRFVIRLAEEMPTDFEVPAGDLSAAIEEARAEFEAAGHPTVVVGEPSDEAISRGAAIMLARIVRESATNIIKYAGPGEVSIVLDQPPDAIAMEIRSPLSSDGPRVISSSGTGIRRMAERVLGVSGEFSAGPDGDDWVVSARFPNEAGNGSGATPAGSASRSS